MGYSKMFIFWRNEDVLLSFSKWGSFERWSGCMVCVGNLSHKHNPSLQIMLSVSFVLRMSIINSQETNVFFLTAACNFCFPPTHFLKLLLEKHSYSQWTLRQLWKLAWQHHRETCMTLSASPQFLEWFVFKNAVCFSQFLK